MRMQVVTIGNLKGGVGKTTSVVNLAYSLSEMGKKVLVIDADPQNNTTSFFGKVNRNGKTLYDVLKSPEEAQACICCTKYKNIDLIRGDIDIEEDDVQHMGWLTILKQHLESEYDFASVPFENYDFVITVMNPFLAIAAKKAKKK